MTNITMKPQLAVAGLLGLLAFASPATAQVTDLEAHFRGKTLEIIIPTGPGGGRALHTLAFASVFGKHVPGNPTITPVFMPGAGGSVGLNTLFTASEPNGLTIATPLSSVLNAQLIGEESVQYDAREFEWIGRGADAQRVLIVSKQVEADTFEQSKAEEVIVGAVGQASETYSNPAFLNQMFGTNFKIISGYNSSANVTLAMMTGETDGSFTTWDNVSVQHANEMADGTIRVLLQIGLDAHPSMPDVPLLLDLAQSEEDKQLVALMSSSAQMGQSFVAPPNTPPEIVDGLRRAFDATMADPEYLAQMDAMNVKFAPVTGEQMTEIVEGILSTPQEIVDRYKSMIAPE